jgi:hypothetical protein
MSTIPVFIPCVNRFDLLEKAIASVPRRLTTEPIVINNSGAELDLRCQVWEPTVPLTATQSLNMMQRAAKNLRVPFYFFMHGDAEAGPETVEKLYQIAMHECSKGKWGVIFTNYDALAAFNTAAFDDVGPWDTVFSGYYADNDIYRRLRLAGYSLSESGLPVVHHGSQTINSDPLRKHVNSITFPIHGQYYASKWGGSPGHETFDKPFGGRFDG